MSDDEQARDDKRQRQMDFILEQQAQFSTDIQQIKETIAAQAEESNARHEQTQTTIHALIAGQERNTVAIGALTESLGVLDGRQQQAWEAIFALTESQDRTAADVRNLTAVVGRVTDAVADLMERDGDGRTGGKDQT